MPKYGSMPRCIYVDSGSEFKSPEFDEVLAQWGCILETSAPHAHWERGLIERHNQTLRSIFNKTFLGTKVPRDLVLTIAVEAKNALSMIRGMSPWQLTTGSNPWVPS